MIDVQQAQVSGTAASYLSNAASFLAACARPALSISANSAPEELSSALTDMVSAAELFGCKPSFWRWAADAASMLGAMPKPIYIARDLAGPDSPVTAHRPQGAMRPS